MLYPLAFKAFTLLSYDSYKLLLESSSEYTSAA